MTVFDFKTKDNFGEEGVNDNFKWQSRQTTPQFPGNSYLYMQMPCNQAIYL